MVGCQLFSSKCFDKYSALQTPCAGSVSDLSEGIFSCNRPAKEKVDCADGKLLSWRTSEGAVSARALVAPELLVILPRFLTPDF